MLPGLTEWTGSQHKKSRLALVAFTLAAALVLAACSRSSNTDIAAEGAGSVSLGAAIIPVTERVAAPDVRGQTLDDDDLGILDYDGYVVVVNAWGSWCAPCRAEAPALEEIYQTRRSDGVRFVGIDTRDQVAAALAFVRNFDITYPSLFDQDGQLLAQFNDSIPTSAIPSTLVLDREGRIAASIIGPTDFSELSRVVDKLAAEPSGA